MRRWRAGTLPRLLVALAFNTVMLVGFLYLRAAYDRAVDCPSGNTWACTGGNQGLGEAVLIGFSVIAWVVGDIVLAALWVRAVWGSRGLPGPGVAGDSLRHAPETPLCSVHRVPAAPPTGPPLPLGAPGFTWQVSEPGAQLRHPSGGERSVWLPPGTTVVETGERRGGFIWVTTADGRCGWLDRLEVHRPSEEPPAAGAGGEGAADGR